MEAAGGVKQHYSEFALAKNSNERNLSKKREKWKVAGAGSAVTRLFPSGSEQDDLIVCLDECTNYL